jgi:YHS domain-containing protein
MRVNPERGATPLDLEHEDSAVTVQDPVCLRRFDLGDAVASIDYDGWAYFFCSDACHRRFQAMPERYGRKPMTATKGSSDRTSRP